MTQDIHKRETRRRRAPIVVQECVCPRAGPLDIVHVNSLGYPFGSRLTFCLALYAPLDFDTRVVNLRISTIAHELICDKLVGQYLVLTGHPATSMIRVVLRSFNLYI